MPLHFGVPAGTRFEIGQALQRGGKPEIRALLAKQVDSLLIVGKRQLDFLQSAAHVAQAAQSHRQPHSVALRTIQLDGATIIPL